MILFFLACAVDLGQARHINSALCGVNAPVVADLSPATVIQPPQLYSQFTRSGWRPFGAYNHFADRCSKLVHARARHDNGVAAAVRFLGDPEEFASVIFPEFNVEMLPLDLQFLRLDDIVHFCEPASLGWFRTRMEAQNCLKMLQVAGTSRWDADPVRQGDGLVRWRARILRGRRDAPSLPFSAHACVWAHPPAQNRSGV
jgi:hypothetical protein